MIFKNLLCQSFLFIVLSESIICNNASDEYKPDIARVGKTKREKMRTLSYNNLSRRTYAFPSLSKFVKKSFAFHRRQDSCWHVFKYHNTNTKSTKHGAREEVQNTLQNGEQMRQGKVEETLQR